jgi:hypothetical protein
MLITLRLPRSSAEWHNITVRDMDSQDLVTTLTAVELAGGLSLVKGKPISPEAVVSYCVAWQAAGEILAALVKKHGRTGLARMVRKACKERQLWAPRRNSAMLEWLQCMLESHFLSQADSPNGARIPDHPVNVEMQGELDLVEVCHANFPRAYELWLISQARRTASEATLQDG